MDPNSPLAIVLGVLVGTPVGLAPILVLQFWWQRRDRSRDPARRHLEYPLVPPGLPLDRGVPGADDGHPLAGLYHRLDERRPAGAPGNLGDPGLGIYLIG
jgi:hypothetical protein